MKEAISILMPIYLASAAIAYVAYLLYRRRLKGLYPDLAARLYPDLVPRSPFTRLVSGHKTWQFVLRREYRSLDNRGFVRLCDCYRMLTFLLWFIFAILVIVGFAS
ncbi:MAG TPA: hypothetical protein VGI03_03060 [Verrucomicrobiae bacterium]|jgi:hypothetical protein